MKVKVKINGEWHTLKVGEFVLFDHTTKTVSIAKVSFTDSERED